MPEEKPSTELSILDVGQGDCIVLHDPEHAEAVLIDCPTGGGQVAIDFLTGRSVEHLRAVIVSHLHKDHYGGIEESLDRLTPVPENLWLSLAYAQGVTSPPAGRAALSLLNRFAKRAGVTRVIPHPNVQLICNRIRLDVLSPDAGAQIEAVATGNPNWSSLIVAADLGGFRALLGADAPPTQWERLVEAGLDLRADVLLMPHHGAAFAANPDRLMGILGAVAPSVIGVSFGSVNSYGHPRSGTLDTLGNYAQETGARLLCTQHNSLCAGGAVPADTACAGTISISGDSDSLVVETGNGGHGELVAGSPAARCR